MISILFLPSKDPGWTCYQSSSVSFLLIEGIDEPWNQGWMGTPWIKYDKKTALCLALGAFPPEPQCHSALCLHPKREVVEKLKPCASLLHFTRLSAVGYRNKRNSRERRQKETGRKPTSFPRLKASTLPLILLFLKFV